MSENRLELVWDEVTGKWHCHGWLNGVRVRRSTKCKDRLGAEEQRMEWLRSGATGRKVTKAGLSFKDLLNVYRKRPQGVAAHLEYKLKTLEKEFGHVKMSAFTEETIDEWRRETGAKRKLLSQDRMLIQVRAVINYAMKKKLIDKKPRFELTADYVQRVVVMEKADRAKLVAAIEEVNEYSAWMVKFLMTTGARVGEAQKLVWEDVDFGMKQVTLTSMKGPKRKVKRRSVPLHPVALEALRFMLKHRVVGQKGQKVFWKKNGRTGEVGPYQWDEYEQSMKIPGWVTAKKAAGFGDLHVHDLRHVFATTLRREQRMSLDRLKDLLGHSKSEMTEIYASLLVEDHRNEVEAISL